MFPENFDRLVALRYFVAVFAAVFVGHMAGSVVVKLTWRVRDLVSRVWYRVCQLLHARREWKTHVRAQLDTLETQLKKEAMESRMAIANLAELSRVKATSPGASLADLDRHTREIRESAKHVVSESGAEIGRDVFRLGEKLTKEIMLAKEETAKQGDNTRRAIFDFKSAFTEAAGEALRRDQLSTAAKREATGEAGMYPTAADRMAIKNLLLHTSQLHERIDSLAERAKAIPKGIGQWRFVMRCNRCGHHTETKATQREVAERLSIQLGRSCRCVNDQNAPGYTQLEISAEALNIL